MDAELIKAIRKINGLNQYQMAKRIGVSRSVLSKIEINNYPITKEVRTSIINEFGVEYVEDVRMLSEGPNRKGAI